MKELKSYFLTRWPQILCVLAGLYAVVVAAYILIETGKPSGSRDFHQFWYAGHFVMQSHDPYAAFFAGDQPDVPVMYLDGVTINEHPVAQPDLPLVPSNTPTMILLLAPFSYFSWDLANHMFLVINLILMAVTGWIVIRSIPFTGVKLPSVHQLLLFLVYFDLSATRIAIENGQTTLLVFLFMLLAILYGKKSWQISGLALGMALSKYSLALPVFVFFLYKKNFKLLLLAILIQVLGVMVLAAITRTAPLTIAMENIRLFVEILSQSGVHMNIASLLTKWTANPLLAQIPVIILTLLVFVLYFLWQRERKPESAATDDVMDFHLLTILFTWTILAGYHRIYDTLILIFFIVLVFKGLAYPNLWKLNYYEKMLLIAFMGTVPLIMILPARIIDQIYSRYYGPLSNGITSSFFVIMLVFSMFLMWKYLRARRN